MTPEFLETIERYYNGSMSKNEQENFETKLSQDAGFKQEVNGHSFVKRAMKRIRQGKAHVATHAHGIIYALKTHVGDGVGAGLCVSVACGQAEKDGQQACSHAKIAAPAVPQALEGLQVISRFWQVGHRKNRHARRCA